MAPAARSGLLAGKRAARPGPGAQAKRACEARFSSVLAEGAGFEPAGGC